MTREVIQVIASYPVLAKQIHLPLQSGDDKLLRRMNRNHNVADYMQVIRDIRDLIPEATIFTSQYHLPRVTAKVPVPTA